MLLGPDRLREVLATLRGRIDPIADLRLHIQTNGVRLNPAFCDVLAEFGHGFATMKLTNTRLEKMTGLTTTWRDLKVVRALAERWGA